MLFRGAYLGPAGDMRLFASIRGKSSESAARATSYKTTLGGRLRAQVSPQVLREWSCDLPLATPEESQHLKAIVAGVLGLGPFAWVPVQATTTNVLSLGASMPGPSHRSWAGAGDPSGAWQVPELGLLRHSVIADGGLITLATGAPVVAGRPVTGAIYVQGAGEIRVDTQTMGPAGEIVDDVSQTLVSAVSPQRVAVTVPAVGAAAVSARIRVSGAMQVGLPSISWTALAATWAPGGGSNQVIIEGFDADLVHVDPRQGLHEDISFTVKELTSDA